MNIKQTVIKIKNTLTSAKTAGFCTNRKNEASNSLPKNAQNPQKTAKNAGISEEAINKREVKATQPVESGRSMVEMLGVLAVIGVLSVAGIAGYQFAMNKYRANQIANELNLAGNQIAFALARPHQESFDLTLGSPFDEGTLSSGFAFTYGCGTDTTMTGCLADDITYYETLSGLPEDLCKTVAQLTQNLSYLVEQRVNDTVDTMGTSCSGDNNELVLLFEIDQYNADDSAGGSGNPNDDLPTGGASPDEWPFLPTSNTYEYCTKDEDCVGNYIACYHGFCVQCLADIDCQDGQYCKRGLCTDNKPECFTNADCAEDEYCGLYSGQCYKGNIDKCNVNSDCPEDSPYCTAYGRCSSDECSENVECQFLGKGTMCYNFKCYDACKSDADCPMLGQSDSYQYCLTNGRCSYSECGSNEDCRARGKGTVCSGNKCYAEGCKSDADCPLSGQSASYKYCHADGSCSSVECSSNDDCPSSKGTVCTGGKCYDACKSDDDCPLSGQSASYKYCHADGRCNIQECYYNDDCPSSKGTVCSGNKCYAEGCKSDDDCPLSGQSDAYKYCHADGTCSSYECFYSEDCTEMNKGISCFKNKCYDGCKSDAECQARDANYPYCHADGGCYYQECSADADCSATGKGSQCIGNECLEACQSDADCESVSSYLRYCLSNGICNHSECRTNSECRTLNKGTKCVYDNVEYAYRCQE